MGEGLSPNKAEMFGRVVDLPIPPLEYYHMLRGFNQLIQEELSHELENLSDEIGGSVTLVTPGSDGRREKGSFASPLEIIALLEERIDPDVFHRSLTTVLQKISGTRLADLDEIKTPDSTLAFFKEDPHRVQPGRIADSRIVYGSPEAANHAKTKLGQEIIDLPQKKIAERVRGLKADARHTTLQGKNKLHGSDAVHFDPEAGKVFFNPDFYQLSFKVGPLRLVQNTLLFEEVKHTRHERNPDFIGTLASGIVHRLEQLSDDKLINLTPEIVREITEHYAFFLRLYHRSEQAYIHGHQTELTLGRTETEEVNKRLRDLADIMQRFRIQKQPH